MVSRRNATLDGIRGVAAIAVLLLHLERPGFQMPLAPFTAVDLFFLISGFVIAQAYEGRISQFGVLAFLRARLTRLYPMLLLGLLILPAYAVLVTLGQHGASPATPWQVLGSLGAGLLFLPSHLPPSKLWDETSLFPLNAPVWSLMFEMAVNLAYALLLPWLSRLMLAFIVLLSGILLVVIQLRLDGIDLGWSWPSLWWGAPRVTFSFFLGVLIWRLKISWRPVHPLLALAAVPALFHAPEIFAVLVGYPLVLVAATSSVSSNLRGSRIMTAMGAMSYPLYVIHFPLLYWLGYLLARRMPEWASLPVSIVLMLLCAFVALKLWDEPVRRWLSRRPATPAAD